MKVSRRNFIRASSGLIFPKAFDIFVPRLHAQSPLGITPFGPGGSSGGGGTVPVGRWKFNEGTGTTANDSSGNGNNGTLSLGNVGSTLPSWTTGPGSNGALAFSGGNAVTIGTSALYQPITGSFTCWINTASTGRMIIASFGEYSTDRNGVVFMTWQGNTADGFVEFESASSNQAVGSSSNTFSTGTWYFYGFTYNGTNAIWYTNSGVLGTPNTYSLVPTNNVNPLWIGCDSNYTSNVFSGSIADVSIFNVILTSTQMGKIVTAGAGNPYSL